MQVSFPACLNSIESKDSLAAVILVWESQVVAFNRL